MSATTAPPSSDPLAAAARPATKPSDGLDCNMRMERKTAPPSPSGARTPQPPRRGSTKRSGRNTLQKRASSSDSLEEVFGDQSVGAEATDESLELNNDDLFNASMDLSTVHANRKSFVGDDSLNWEDSFACDDGGTGVAFVSTTTKDGRTVLKSKLDTFAECDEDEEEGTESSKEDDFKRPSREATWK